VSVAGDAPAYGADPVPVRLTVCVLPFTPLLLSVIVNVPVRAPFFVGAKLSFRVQDPLGATLPLQLFVWLKSAPVVMLAIVSVAVPLLLKVTGCAALVVPTAWLAKDRPFGEADPSAPRPVPVKLTVWVLPGVPPSSSVTESVPFCSPTTVGVNVTKIKQLPEGESGVEQLSVSANPTLAEIPEMDRFWLPVSVTNTVCVALPVPTFCGAKARLEGERDAVGTLEGVIFAMKVVA